MTDEESSQRSPQSIVRHPYVSLGVFTIGSLAGSISIAMLFTNQFENAHGAVFGLYIIASFSIWLMSVHGLVMWGRNHD